MQKPEAFAIGRNLRIKSRGKKEDWAVLYFAACPRSRLGSGKEAMGDQR